MYNLLLLLLLTYYLANASPHHKETPFLKYSLESLHNDKDSLLCRNPDFYFEEADREESDPANQDKIILYHGEAYGTWIYQMILKAFMYPEAPDDWLPLRFGLLDNDIDKSNLLRLMHQHKSDHHTGYVPIGLSVTPNLHSKSITESAWGTICKRKIFSWQVISGFSDFFGEKDHRYYRQLKERFIPNEEWDKFLLRRSLLGYFIQEKRRLYETIFIHDYKEKMKEYFPNTLKHYYEKFESLFERVKKEKVNHINFEGVALQIIMDKEIADHITYNAHPMGLYKDNGKYVEPIYKHEKNIWDMQDVVPYSEAYKHVKNHKDYEQARVALTNDFRRYPSRIRIKAIAGIMENPTDYEIIKSMINEMVDFRRNEQ